MFVLSHQYRSRVMFRKKRSSCILPHSNVYSVITRCRPVLVLCKMCNNYFDGAVPTEGNDMKLSSFASLFQEYIYKGWLKAHVKSLNKLIYFVYVCVTQVRSTISDFAVFITIMIMVLVDYLMGIPSPKLNVPDRFEVGILFICIAPFITIEHTFTDRSYYLL